MSTPAAEAGGGIESDSNEPPPCVEDDTERLSLRDDDVTDQLEQSTEGVDLPEADLVEIRRARNVSLLYLPKPGAEVTFILVHGACATWRQFRMMIPSLASVGTVVTYDVYGCGESPKPNQPEAYSTEALFEDLKAVWRLYAGPKTIVIGHSFGSSQSMRLAGWLENIEDVRLCGLVLLASALHVQDGGHLVFDLPLPLLNVIHPIISLVFKAQSTDKKTTSTPPRNLTTGATPTVTPTASPRQSHRKKNPPYMFKAFYNQMRWVNVKTIERIQTPTVIIHGENDRIIPLKQARALASRLPNSFLYIFRRTGHQIHQERHRETVDFTLRFMEQIVYPPQEDGGLPEIHPGESLHLPLKRDEEAPTGMTADSA